MINTHKFDPTRINNDDGTGISPLKKHITPQKEDALRRMNMLVSDITFKNSVERSDLTSMSVPSSDKDAALYVMGIKIRAANIEYAPRRTRLRHPGWMNSSPD